MKPRFRTTCFTNSGMHGSSKDSSGSGFSFSSGAMISTTSSTSSGSELVWLSPASSWPDCELRE